MMRDVRLGDDIDDFCVRCKRIMNHAVVSVINAEAAKVRCRTCHSDHDYRHELAPPPKVDPRKAALFAEVLKKVSPTDGAAASVPDGEDPIEAVEALEAVDTIEEAPVPAAEEEPAPPPKAKAAKAKGRAKK
jgi:hypothetical protein